jgi:hypothetical protein
MVNLVMALASYQEARSPIELSLSPVYQYQFSSISKALDCLCSDTESRAGLQRELQRLCMTYFNHALADYFLLQTDTTPLCKAYSPTLPERTFVAMPNNAVPGNRPLNIGYETSCINLCDPQSNWSLPLTLNRVALEETASDCALEQLAELLSHPDLPFDDKLVINTCDSKYGNAEYLSRAYKHSQVVHVIRLRSGMRIWDPYQGSQRSGRKRVYGEKYYLHRNSRHKSYRNRQTSQPQEVFQRSLFERLANEHVKIDSQTAKGRRITIELWRFNNMMMRSKTGYNMKDKLLDIIAVEVRDSDTGKLLFDREMYIGLCGQRKEEISMPQAHHCYRQRFGIEHYLRFAKQRLLMQRYQTPDIEHLDNWLLIQQIVPWLLYAASDETTRCFRKWEQYLPENKTDPPTERLSISQTRRALQTLFLTLDLTPFKPLKSIKGKGRATGTTFEPRKRYKRVKKVAHKRKSKTKIEQIE